jgi:hypothetical protein
MYGDMDDIKKHLARLSNEVPNWNFASLATSPRRINVFAEGASSMLVNHPVTFSVLK